MSLWFVPLFYPIFSTKKYVSFTRLRDEDPRRGDSLFCVPFTRFIADFMEERGFWSRSLSTPAYSLGGGYGDAQALSSAVVKSRGSGTVFTALPARSRPFLSPSTLSFSIFLFLPSLLSVPFDAFRHSSSSTRFGHFHLSSFVCTFAAPPRLVPFPNPSRLEPSPRFQTPYALHPVPTAATRPSRLC